MPTRAHNTPFPYPPRMPPSRPSNELEYVKCLVDHGVARVTSIHVTADRYLTMRVELDDRAKQLEKELEAHAVGVDAILDGHSIDMDTFQALRHKLRGWNEAVRMVVALREAPIREHLPPEEGKVDPEVERRELVAAHDEWTKVRFEYATASAARAKGVPIEVSLVDRMIKVFERYDFAKQRVECLLVGLPLPPRYERNMADYKL